MNSTSRLGAAALDLRPPMNVLEPRFDTIPSAMTNVRQWVTWRLEHRDDKATKVLINAGTGYNASSTDPSTWTTLDVAAGAYRCSRGYHGVGFVLAPPFAGVDLDHCRDTETGAIASWAAKIVAQLDSYTELSPSGTGVHIIMQGMLPPGRRRKGPVEMYDCARYFTVTGHALLSGRRAVEQRFDALAQLHRATFGEEASAAHTPHVWRITDTPPRDLRERAARGRIRRETLTLLDTVGGDRYGSPSEADAAVAAGLIGAGLTAEEALTLLADSVRGHDAMQRKGETHGEWYLRRTVEHAAVFVGPVVELPHGRARLVSRPTTRPYLRVGSTGGGVNG